MAISRDLQRDSLLARTLRLMNLRTEESGRTFWMFLSYAATSVGVLWLEATASALFLEHFSADNLPFIYLSSTLLSIFLGFLYGLMQSIIPLRWVIVLVSLMMAIPVFLFRQGLMLPAGAAIGGFVAFKAVVLCMRLWLQVVYVLNDLNTTITANQLFNVRELRRTYPLISSGVLVADAASGFLLPMVSDRFGLSGVTTIAFSMMTLGSMILLYITRKQARFFDTTLRRRESSNPESGSVLQGQSMNYRWMLLLFFVLAEIIFLLLDFQFSKELEGMSVLPLFNRMGQTQSERIASFLGLFQGVLGIFELLVQWFASRWVIEKLGVFGTTGILPTLMVALGGTVAILSVLPNIFPALASDMSLFKSGAVIFWAIVLLKFLYELFHFTLLASVGPVLFQPVPQKLRNMVQTNVRGNAEPLANGLTGLLLVGLIYFGWQQALGAYWRGTIFSILVVLSGVWLVTIYILRRKYAEILILSARQDLLVGRTTSDSAKRELKRAAIDALSKPGMEESQMGCVELLLQVDERNALEILVPMLQHLPEPAKCRILGVMQNEPNAEYAIAVSRLISPQQPDQVVAEALRYIYHADPGRNLQQLVDYLRPQAPALVRATSSVLLLEFGDRDQRAKATNLLRLMLTNPNQEERRASCGAIRNLKYLQALQLYILEIVKQESDIDVRCAVLDVVAATHFEKCYPTLVEALRRPETRGAAIKALILLKDEALPLLQPIAQNWREGEAVRASAWDIIGQVGSREAIDFLIQQLPIRWSNDRTNILRALIKIQNKNDTDSIADTLGRTEIEALLEQDLMLIAQVTAAILDISGRVKSRDLEEMLYRALQGVQADAIDRIFLLMQFLYESEAIQAAAYSLKSGINDDVAQGLEILDTKLDIPQKRALLVILENNLMTGGRSTETTQGKKRGRAKKKNAKLEAPSSKLAKSAQWRLTRQEQLGFEMQLQSLSSIMVYSPLEPLDRIKHLLDLRHFLSDWVTACCFHLVRSEAWQLDREQILSALRGGSSLLRESALLYLYNAQQRGQTKGAFLKVLPRMQNDADPLLRRQIQQWMADYQIRAEGVAPIRPEPEAEIEDIPQTEIFGYRPRSLPKPSDATS
jgi:HEAT repeat protein